MSYHRPSRFGPRGRIGPQLSNKRYKNHVTGIMKAVRGIGSLFPSTHRLITFTKDKSNSSYGETVTTSGSTFSESQIKFSPHLHKGTPDQIIGKSAETALHEMHVHALQDLSNNSRRNSQSSAHFDHTQMHQPSTRRNFLGAARRVFNQMDNASQKRAFAHEYFSDMSSEINSAGLDADTRRERTRWARARRNSMLDAIDNPNSHNWVAQDQQRNHLFSRMRRLRRGLGYDD